MQNYEVTKTIAFMEGPKFINRVVETTTGKEMGDFISGIRPEFKAGEILAVKFEVYCTSEVDPDSTPWFINPSVPLLEEVISTDDFGPVMGSEYIPELLFVKKPDILSSYEDFIKMENVDELSDEEKWTKFMLFLESR